MTVPVECIPLFVKAGTVLPLAQPTLNTDDPASWKLTALIFGDGSRSATLFEDDGSVNPELTEVHLEWDAAARSGRTKRSSPAEKTKYEIIEWRLMP